MDDESEAWLTYAEAGQRLGVSAEAVRAKAIRKRWRRQPGNDGKTLIKLPPDERTPVDQPVNARSPHVRKAVDSALATALDHIETLKAQLAAAETRANEEADVLREHVATLKAELERRGAEIETLKAQLAAAEARASEEAARTAQETAALEAHNETLKADVEALKEQLTAAEARAEKQATEFAARDAERLGEALSAERARTAQTIAAFERLAERLEAMAATRKPWWRRIFTAPRRRSPASA